MFVADVCYATGRKCYDGAAARNICLAKKINKTQLFKRHIYTTNIDCYEL